MSARSGKRKEELLARGSIYTFRRKCGKDYCRCTGGELHETPALSYTVDGKTRILTLGKEDVPGVRAAIARYKKARKELDAEALRGIEVFRGEIRARKVGRGEGR